MLGKLKREEIVKNIQENKLIVKYGFDPIDISEGVDWHYMHGDNAKTYSVYLHSLEYVGYLVLTDNDSEEKREYFAIANDILNSWINANRHSPSEHSWNEHAVSYRLSNLILYQDTVSEEFKLDRDLFNKLIIKHCEFLADDKNYKPNNHGILMDESLFKASFYINDIVLRKLYKSISLNRVKLALYRDFSRKGLHSENSPEYHRMMLIVLNRFNELLKEKNESLTNDLNHKLKKAKRLLRILLMPDSTYPLVGDTSHRTEENLMKDFSDYIDYETGLTIFQNENKKDSKKSDYLYFKCGYLSKTHKHFDDLSISLMLDGNQLFIDAGKYNYNKKDPIREYVVSSEAHTVPLILNKKYSPTSPIVDQYNLGILNTNIKSKHKIVKAYNSLYENLILFRTAILSDNGHFIVVDEVETDNIETLILNFNINENAIIKLIDHSTAEVLINDDKYILKSFFNDDVDIETVKGYYSKTFSKYNENMHIRFNHQPGVKKSIIALYNVNKPINIIEYDSKTIKYEFENNIIVVNL